MRQAKFKVLKLTTLAIAIASTGGCITAKTNPGDKEAMAAPAPEKEMAAAPMAMKDEVTSYTVVSGDHLWGISGKNEIYNNSLYWPLIYRSNFDQIEDPDLIFSGQMLKIGRDYNQGDMDGAVMHAQNRGAWTVGGIEESDGVYRSSVGG